LVAVVVGQALLVDQIAVEVAGQVVIAHLGHHYSLLMVAQVELVRTQIR
jgi:hypothetical protein